MGNGRIPDAIIDAVLKHHDIVDVVGRYVSLSKQGHYMKGLCPFHSEKSPSFTVTPEKQIYHCFGCGAGGNSIQFIMDKEGYSFGEAVRQLAEDAEIPITWETSSPQETGAQRDRSAVMKAHELATKLYQYILRNTDQGRGALEYLRSRGLTDKHIETFGIGYAPPMWEALAKQLEKHEFDLSLMEKGGLLSARHEGGGYIDRFRDRIMFPIHDALGNVIAFAGRALGDVQPKYLNSPETMLFNKSRSLFHLHGARPHIRKTGTIVLFEGYMDVIKAWEAEVLTGIATMGTALTPEQADMISRMAKQVILCYDGDSAGQAAAYKNIPILEKAGCDVSIAMIPDNKDPDDYISSFGSERFVKEIIEAAVPTVRFQLLHIRKNFKLGEERDRLRYLHKAMEMIAELPSPLERGHYLRDLSSEFHVSYEDLKHQVNETRLKEEKNKSLGDKKQNPWNNVMNNGRSEERNALYPAYHNAERQLLALMMHDGEICMYVQEHLGDGFNIEAHAVLAAYLYAYYTQHQEPSPSRYMTMLEDDGLKRLAVSIALIGDAHAVSHQVIDDYIREIRKYPKQQAIIRKREEMTRVEREGNPQRAAQILTEIISLEKELHLRK
ncbi:DNA primase [Paenibacillus sp. N1-5-1-14]|uniref:DNA primase n=1 Tax=Paenibacillus radicibacter TaxID=2972488 RepID=UPI0021590514|nr:DNA primase [Paenibacillus radicibacter]MCR8641965.1 DNA primase [Paenibacillus radicibacter]